MKRIKLLSILLLLISSFLSAQGTSGTNAKFEYRSLVDMPTAGILEKGYVGVSTDILPAGVVISKIEVGVFDNFSFGISYGGVNIIGSGPVDWYKLPGVNLRARIFDETQTYPAITVGFDSQGKGLYFDSNNRFEIKSPGFFAAVSKNYEFLGYLSIHGIVNYSLEREDGDKDLNLQAGLEKTIGGVVSIVAEYDFAVNDNTSISIGDGNGYLNMGLRWSAGEGFTIGVDLRDMLDNKKINSNKADRAIFVEYVRAIF
ncbi:MAG: YjbH domain-containing protein [Melioribacteraceae bacterium]|nr:YjbH domain-containing protein [Melioribacteraceae bacterium]MCF8355501.1 YjbH domain-containing protein [Melioribacteraceae bacterium]MCF8394189.1 YjbH domain-containing protein [Melioribacteraceae bacterium]MCF8419909.1 YjbH domain-containing protein [Melioribacteraceae bacterium]